MPDLNDFLARGRIVQLLDRAIVFHPTGTNYRMHLALGDEHYTGPVNELISCRIRAKARKIITVPSGGLFVTPIFGSPRIIQGRVRYLDAGALVVHAGTNFIVELPAADSAIDLPSGAIATGNMVNVTIWPEAIFELVESASVAPAIR